MPSAIARISRRLAVGCCVGALSLPSAVQPQSLPGYLRDRGTGIPTSRFGTYVEPRQLLINPFFAYSFDSNREYQPAHLGFGLDQDFRGRFRGSEELLFIGYGVTDWLAVEFEAGVERATLDKAAGDPSATPTRIKESGFGDVEGQLRLRFRKENAHHPEIFSFLEMTPATQRKKVLIDEPNWDLKPGVGLIRGYSWGTLMLRVAAEWNREASSPDLGEVAVEYLRRLSSSVRLNVTVEGGEGGAPDEFDFITGVNWRLNDALSLKFDNAVGISSKATDWAPEIGVIFSVQQPGYAGNRGASEPH